MNNKRKKILRLCWILGIILILMLMFILLGGVKWAKQWITSFKEPSAYTWDEYQALDHEEKDEFFERFDTLQDFEDWKETAQPKETEPDFHWDEPGKKPNEYNWEEYMELTEEQKEAFFLWFSSTADFEAWKSQVQSEEAPSVNLVWDEQGKRPDEYTWAEYEALSHEKQDAFYLWFDSKDAFEAWMSEAKPAETEPADPSWNIPGKKPKDYTWEEYQKLSPEQQDAFYNWFASMSAFEAWMDSAKPDESSTENVSWNKPGKNPDEYSYDEYQALSAEDQELFYQWFDSRDAFEAWMDQAEQNKQDQSSEIDNQIQ